MSNPGISGKARVRAGTPNSWNSGMESWNSGTYAIEQAGVLGLFEFPKIKDLRAFFGLWAVGCEL